MGNSTSLGPEKHSQGDLRNRSKKKAFDKMWSTYSDQFRAWFDGLSRHEQSKYVNESMIKDSSGHYSNGVMAKFRMLEAVETSRSRSSTWGSTGVILEVAAAKCGGMDALKGAIARGAVRVQTQGGVQLFTFPEIGTHVADTKSKKITSTADTPVIEDMHNEMRDLHGLKCKHPQPKNHPS